MKFETFLARLPLIQGLKLEINDIHQQMAVANRQNLYQELKEKPQNKPRKAAVLALIFPKENQAYILLIIRSKYNGIHSSEVAFPGGKMEFIDSDLYQTALRETLEEVGISSVKISKIRNLTPLYIAPSNFEVAPFLALHENPMQLTLDAREVESVLELPLSFLLKEDVIKKSEVTVGGNLKLKTPSFVFNDEIIWGATAMILNEIKHLIKNSL